MRTVRNRVSLAIIAIPWNRIGAILNGCIQGNIICWISVRYIDKNFYISGFVHIDVNNLFTTACRKSGIRSYCWSCRHQSVNAIRINIDIRIVQEYFVLRNSGKRWRGIDIFRFSVVGEITCVKTSVLVAIN